jgi:hypothetical protein
MMPRLMPADFRFSLFPTQFLDSLFGSKESIMRNGGWGVESSLGKKKIVNRRKFSVRTTSNRRGRRGN